MRENGGTRSLARHELTGRDGEKHTGAEDHEESGGHKKIVPGEYYTHSASDERVNDKEY